ncbi:hypothetical protein LuPra_05187 [Luteitalea pratensis]|uniref:DUF1778 domain-containing protein n=1 Tax=Luteitalea pratensis TaxID=1855912 RepID=A0A143PT62_LUTPR|nr:DUF1778 domain-containing protein [Luteitalea pratensis]AMY11917.1 hypothetical protein LuPra_05187 [Luteitalea pratensis]
MDKKASPSPTTASHRAPEHVAESLPDRTRFEIGARDWAEFKAALDGPPRDLPRLAQLLNKPSVFEQ